MHFRNNSISQTERSNKRKLIFKKNKKSGIYIYKIKMWVYI